MIAPDPAIAPAIFILFEDCSTFGSADGVGEALKLISVTGDFVLSSDLLEPKTEAVLEFWVLEAGEGETLVEGLGDFDLLDVEEVDWEVVL